MSAAARHRFAGRLALERRSIVAAVVATSGLALAIVGQRFLDRRPDLWGDGALAFAAAAALWLFAMLLWPEPDAPFDAGLPAEPGPALSRERRLQLAAGLALVLLTAVVAPIFTGARGGGLGLLLYPLVPADGPLSSAPDATNTFTRLGAFLWLAGTLLCLWSLAQPFSLRRQWLQWVSPAGLRLHVSWPAVAVIAITLLGVWFRFHDLAGVPLEMTSDHTEKVLDVASVVEGLRPVYLPNNAGREPLEFYWLAFLVWLGVPNGFMLLKLGMAVVSSLTIPFVYLLGKRIAGVEVGLLAALVMALSYWHVVITRIGLRIAFSPLFAALTLYFLYRALQSGRRNDFLALGVCLGAGLYGYSGFRPMFFVVPAVVAMRLAHDAFWRWRDRRPGPLVPRPVWGHLAAAGTATLLLATPMMRYAVDRPAAFWGRTASRMLGTEKATELPILEQLIVNIRQGLLMFNYSSDAAWFQAAPYKPALEVVGGALFVLAVVTVLVRVARRDWQTGALLLIVPLMLLSSILALSFPDENPSFSRAAGALPAVAVLVALPLPLLGDLWRAAVGAAWGAVAYLMLLFVLVVGMFRGATSRYFMDYASAYDAATQNTSEGAAVARSYLAAGVDLDHVYLVGWSNGWDYRAVGTLLGNPRWQGLLWGGLSSGEDAVEAAEPHAADPAAKLYLVGGAVAEKNVEYLKKLYPAAQATKHASRLPGKEFWSVYVPARPAEGAGG